MFDSHVYVKLLRVKAALRCRNILSQNMFAQKCIILHANCQVVHWWSPHVTRVIDTPITSTTILIVCFFF